jgi:hypothetical protein
LTAASGSPDHWPDSTLLLNGAYRDVDRAPGLPRELLIDAVGGRFTLGGLHGSEIAVLIKLEYQADKVQTR